jgi:hypothetical protein
VGIVHLHDVGVGGSGIKVFRLKCGIPLSVLGGDKLKFTMRGLRLDLAKRRRVISIRQFGRGGPQLKSRTPKSSRVHTWISMVLSAQLLVVCGLAEVHNGTTAEPVWVDSLMRWSRKARR